MIVFLQQEWHFEGYFPLLFLAFVGPWTSRLYSQLAALAGLQKLLSSAAIFVAFISFANQGSAPLAEQSGVFCCEGAASARHPHQGG